MYDVTFKSPFLPKIVSKGTFQGHIINKEPTIKPVNNEIVDFKNQSSLLTIGKSITIYGDNQSNLKGFDIALIGLSECRKSSEVNKKYLDINSFRKEFYSLFCGDWNVNIIDMGDVISGDDISDTYFALKTINESLLEKNT